MVAPEKKRESSVARGFLAPDWCAGGMPVFVLCFGAMMKELRISAVRDGCFGQV